MNPNRTKHIVGIVIGAVLLIGAPIIARVLYVSGMQRAFDTLGSGPGIADPNRLSGDISAVLYACAGGLGGTLIGLTVLIVSVVLYVRAGRRLSTPNVVTNATENASPETKVINPLFYVGSGESAGSSLFPVGKKDATWRRRGPVWS